MRRVLLIAAGLLAIMFASRTVQAGPLDDLTASDQSAIREVVQQQLDAFKTDDSARAFSYASPTIKGLFGSAENFLNMVKSAYPPVYRPREIEVRDVVDYQGQPTLRVLLIGPDGVPKVAYYMMQRQPDGSWLINGCYLLGSAETTT